MHQSATDIAIFTTGRASILIGPRGAFGAQKQDLLLRDASRIRAELDRLLMQDGNRMMLRPYIARWGLDTNVLTRSDRSLLADWLTQKVVAGIIGIIVVPDPIIAFAGLVEKQEATALALKGSQALDISEEPATMLPAGLDDRFLILLSMVPDHLEGAVKRKFTDMIDAIGLEVIAVGLLIWIGAHFVPGLNLVVLAFDLFFLSGEVIRAIETVAKSIDDVALARTRSDLTPIAKILAAAIAVLVVNGVLNRFLKAKKIPRGQSKSTSGRGRKRTRQSTPAASSSSSRPPRTKPKKKQSDSDDGDGHGTGEPNGSDPANLKKPVDISKMPKELDRTPSSGVKLVADPNKTTTVLGKYDSDMKHVIKELDYPETQDFGAKKGGFNVLNVPDNIAKKSPNFWKEHNVPFLDAAIKRGDNFPLTNRPTPENLWKSKNELSGFGKEMAYLKMRGYKYDPITSSMVKP